jgi:hypothetical protein
MLSRNIGQRSPSHVAQYSVRTESSVQVLRGLFDSGDEGTANFRNVGNFTPNDTVSQSRGHKASVLVLV